VRILRPLRATGAWLVDRLGLADAWKRLAKHPVPPGAASKGIGWVYVLGFVAVALFALQIVTGSALLTRYIPSTGAAYESIRTLMEESWAGRLARGMHFWGASAMIVVVLLHMVRVFLMGSYKFPREMNWITGVFLLVLVLLMGFTGQLLRWNQDGLWGVVVASQYAGRVPWIGEGLKRLILAGDFVGSATLSRFFALHVVILPLLLIGFVGMHLYLVLRHGISEPPRPGESVDRRTYRDRYRALLEREGVPYWPNAAWQEVFVVGVTFVAVFLLAMTIGPRALGAPPDPSAIASHPRPDWFLMWYYALIAVKPRGLEDFTMVLFPVLVLIGLLVLPLVRPEGERAPSRRPLAIVLVVVAALFFGTLTGLGYRGSWVPEFESPAFSAEELGDVPEAAARGAVVFHAHACQACHTVAGRGGTWGPELTNVTDRMPGSTIVHRIVNGLNEMPAYRDALTDEELSAILSFLAAIRERDGGG
jgi:ubiquinol-cytochrome c reductase cytochrome b subunit